MRVAASRPDEHANHNAEGDDDESEAEKAQDEKFQGSRCAQGSQHHTILPTKRWWSDMPFAAR